MNCVCRFLLACLSSPFSSLRMLGRASLSDNSAWPISPRVDVGTSSSPETLPAASIVSLPRLHPRVTRDFRFLSSSQFRYQQKKSDHYSVVGPPRSASDP